MEKILERCPECGHATLVQGKKKAYSLNEDEDARLEEGIPLFIWCDCAFYSLPPPAEEEED